MKIGIKFGRLPGRQQSRRLYHTGIIIAVGLLFTFIAVYTRPFTSINSWLSDQLFVSESPSPNVVIVGIDDSSLETYGKWSEWPRTLHARAIRNLTAAGARVIAFDVLFADDSKDDAELAEAIEENGNVVLPVAGVAPLSAYGQPVVYDDILHPATILENASCSIGHANIVPDTDGVVRRLPLVVTDNAGNAYPSMSLTVLHRLLFKQLPDKYEADKGSLFLLDRTIPVDHSCSLRVNYTSLNNSYPLISYKDVINRTFDSEAVEHKIVLIGMTATGDLDTWATPISPAKVPGVWIHANTIDTILRERFLQDGGTTPNLLILLFLTLVAGIAFPRLNIKYGIIAVVVLIAAYLAGVFYAFDNGILLKVLYPVLLLPLLFLTAILCMVLYEQSDKRLIKSLFGRYVSPQVATEILALTDSGQLRLGGEQRTVTVLFADIRGFTHMSESMSPPDVVEMLNKYLGVLIDKVLEYDGMVNKFAGDCIMAVWNAPKTQDDHAFLAAKAAWESQKLIATLQEHDESLPSVKFGIGINTGEAVAGSLGSTGRAEYTVIGDSVNLASRICSATPGGEIWIGPETYRQIASRIVFEELGPQLFKGKSGAVTAYRVLEIK